MLQWSLSELDQVPQLPHSDFRQVLGYPVGYLSIDDDWYPHCHSAPLPPLQLFSVTAKDKLVMELSRSLSGAGTNSTSHRLQSGNGEGSTGMHIGKICVVFRWEGFLCRLCSPLSLDWALIHASAKLRSCLLFAAQFSSYPAIFVMRTRATWATNGLSDKGKEWSPARESRRTALSFLTIFASCLSSRPGIQVIKVCSNVIQTSEGKSEIKAKQRKVKKQPLLPLDL